MKTIKTIIQGDTYNYMLRLDKCRQPLDHNLIDEVHLTCSDLTLDIEMTWNANFGCYVCGLTSSETEAFAEGCHYFNITATLIDNSIKTPIYKGTFRVLKKGNSNV